MPSKNKAGGCGCCNDCCITPKKMKITASYGDLGSTDAFYTPDEEATIHYEEDFEAETISTPATDLGWTKHSGSVSPTAFTVQSGKVLEVTDEGTHGIERTFTDYGTFKYSWATSSTTDLVRVYRDDTLVNEHSAVGGGSGSDEFTVWLIGGLESTVRIEVVVSSGGSASVDNLSLEGYEPSNCDRNAIGYANTTTTGCPLWACNVLVSEGSWFWQEYYELGQIQCPTQCYKFNTTSPTGSVSDWHNQFTAQEEPIVGEIELIKQDEPDCIPFETRVYYYIYVDGDGHCILRILATVAISSLLRPLDRDSGLLGGTLGSPWNYTVSSGHQYSSYHPCAEDLGVLPLPYGCYATPSITDPGAWRNGSRTVLGSVPGLHWDEGFNFPDLWTTEDLPEYRTEVWTDASFMSWTTAPLGWVWEVDLTDSGITNLDDLPTLTLDWTNVVGVIENGNITNPYTPVASLPSGFFDQETEVYEADSLALGPETFFADVSTIVNGGDGTHVCVVGSDEGVVPCGLVYGTFYIHRALQNDTILWRYRQDVDSDRTVMSFKDFSITFEPA